MKHAQESLKGGKVPRSYVQLSLVECDEQVECSIAGMALCDLRTIAAHPAWAFEQLQSR